MKLYSMVGYKLFKQREDGSIHMIRIVWVHRPYKITPGMKDPVDMTIYDYEDDMRKKVKVEDYSDYSPLEPDGIFTISIALVRDSKGKACKDVMATVTHYKQFKELKNMMPYAVCRQNISDVFYNLLTDDEHNQLVGVAISQDTCPANFDYGIMFAADSIEFNEFINFYRTDTIEDILKMVKKDKYDNVLKDLYMRHVKASGDMTKSFLDEDMGWCKNVETLLKVNNFQSDINMMLGISQVDFDIKDYLVSKASIENNVEYKVADDEFRTWLSYTYKMNISEASVIKYDHDINLDDFKNSSYALLRDNTQTLYLIVYTVKGEYLEADLEAKAKQMDFSTKFKLDYYNKYNLGNN